MEIPCAAFINQLRGNSSIPALSTRIEDGERVPSTNGMSAAKRGSAVSRRQSVNDVQQ